MNDYLDSILTEIKETISNHSPPEVNKTEKKISVTYDFDAGYIKKVKLIASKEKWLDLINEYPENLAYDEVFPLLSRPSKTLRHKLKEYAEDRQNDFTTDVLICIDSANMSNPLFKLRVIPRKNPYNLSHEEKNQITMIAVRLYLFLERAGKISQKEWPDYFLKFMKGYKIKPIGLKGHLDITEEVRKVIRDYFGIDNLGPRFWQTFVTESPVKLKAARALKPLTPDEDPLLKELFKEFI